MIAATAASTVIAVSGVVPPSIVGSTTLSSNVELKASTTDQNVTIKSTVSGTGYTLKTTATKTSNVGTYVIGNDNVKLTDNGTFKASNYEMNFINGTLTITKADNTLKVNAKTLTYNTTAQELV